MHNFLKSIGFSKYTHYYDLKPVLNDIVENPDWIESCELIDSTVYTMEKIYGNNTGIGVFGEYDDDNNFHIEYYYPFYNNKRISSNFPVIISRLSDKNAFAALCDDLRIGIPLIFNLQNTCGYLNSMINKLIKKDNINTHLSAFASEGKILIPLKKSKQRRISDEEKCSKRIQMIKAARKGDNEALEFIAEHDMQEMESIVNRIHRKSENLYSIIDSSLIPRGMECNRYTILGDIIELEYFKNSLTEEQCYIFLVRTNDIDIPVIINCRDLFGEPQVYRRFKGEIWLTGRVDFKEEI